MKYILTPSLLHITVAKIAVTLWNQKDVRTLIENLPLRITLGISYRWQHIEDNVIRKGLDLPLPRLLKKEILGCIKPVGKQIRKWIEYHLPCYSLSVVLPSEFCWSQQGTVDWKKTAKVLIKDKNIDLLNCYKLACIYCLDDDILELGNKIPEIPRLSSSHSWENITIPWMHIRNERSQSRSISYQGEFENFALKGNKPAAEYFFNKLTASEKEESVVKVTRYVQDDEILYFLLSQMDEKQQMEVFKRSAYNVLSCFLAWPLQSFFIETASNASEFLLDEDYVYILLKIIHKVKRGYKDWDYQHLFRKIWQKCPKYIKTLLIDQFNVLSLLLGIKDEENLKVVFQNATARQKKKFIYSSRVLDIVRKFLCDDEWNLLTYIIQECLSSKYKMVKFKKAFQKHLKLCDIRYTVSALNKASKKVK